MRNPEEAALETPGPQHAGKIPGDVGAVRPVGRHAWAVVALVALVVGVAGRAVYLLNRGDLWFDEAITASLMTRSPVDLALLFSVPGEVRSTVLHAHGPLYYPLLRGWSALLGRGELALRGFSLLFGVGSLLLLWKLARDHFGAPAAALAVAAMAVAPIQVHYSAETRYYTLFLFLCLGSLWSFLDILAREKGHLRYVAFTTLSVYTFYYGWFVVLVLNLGFLVSFARDRRPRLLPWALGQAAVAVLFLPWLGVMYHQYTSLAGGPFSSWGQLAAAFRPLLVDLAAMGLPTPWLPALAVAATGLVLLGLWSLRQRPALAATLLLWLALTILLHRYVGTVRIVSRAFIFIPPALYLLAAAAAADALRRPRRALSLGTLLLFAAFLAMSVVGATRLQRNETEIRLANPSLATLGDLLRRSPERSAAVVLIPGRQVTLLDYYLDSPFPVVGLHGPRDRNASREELDVHLAASLRQLAGAFSELWVCTPSHEQPLPASCETAAGQAVEPLEVHRFGLFSVRRFRSADLLAACAPDQRPENAGAPRTLPVLVTLGEESALERQVQAEGAARLELWVLARYPDQRPFYGRLELAVDDQVVDTTLLGCDYASLSLLRTNLPPGAHRIAVKRLPPAA